ncbi:MAG: LysR family transcriptional regulator [Candidatus Thiodiazotropha taylori]|nr:LysR family transcriptional regulator [Shewanella sp.]MCG7912179.1 LysR family transcriptional regulator [Candidatus Thiodiazotropha taylori]MCG7927313.1 LysR family transcriptional regulator [Candidatus Thiodiazotropha taylori]
MANAEQLFLQVVESGSLKKAAEHLNVEPSSVSRKIAALEDRLKVKLLRRSTQRTSPTELGQLYYEKLRVIIDDQLALEEEISSGVDRLRGRLRIAAPVDFGAQFVVPVVRKMQHQSPDLNVELLLGSQFENLLEKNLDLAVRIGELPDSNLIAKSLGQVDRVLVASPDYLREYGTPENVDQLAAHNFILYSPVQAKSDIEFADGCRYAHTRIKSNITVNSVTAVRNLVLQGVGIHLGPHWVFKQDLEQRRVCQLLADRPLRSFPVHAVYLARSYLPFKIKEFTRLLSTSLS